MEVMNKGKISTQSVQENVAYGGKGQDSDCGAVRTESMESRFPCAMCLNQAAPEIPRVRVLDPSLQGFTAFMDSADSQTFQRQEMFSHIENSLDEILRQ